MQFRCFFFFKQKTAYELRISDWSSDVCSSDLAGENFGTGTGGNIAVNATAGGTISTGNRLTAQAMGGSMSDTIRQSAGNGIGGNVDFLADAGTIRAEDYRVDASGNTADVTGAGGTAQGGTIDLFAQNGGLFVAKIGRAHV